MNQLYRGRAGFLQRRSASAYKAFRVDGALSGAETIDGVISDTNNVPHVFLRAPDGKFTMFNAPGAGTGTKQGTRGDTLYGINQLGVITGMYVDSCGAAHRYGTAPGARMHAGS